MKMPRYFDPRSKKGTTLVEMVIYIALISIFMLMMSELFSSAMSLRQESGRYQSVEENGRFILSRMMYDAARATAVTNPLSVGSTANQLVLNIEGTTHTYSLNSNNLVLDNGINIQPLNSNLVTVTSFSAQKVSTSHIKVDFVLQSVDMYNGEYKVKNFSITLGQR